MPLKDYELRPNGRVTIGGSDGYVLETTNNVTMVARDDGTVDLYLTPYLAEEGSVPEPPEEDQSGPTTPPVNNPPAPVNRPAPVTSPDAPPQNTSPVSNPEPSNPPTDPAQSQPVTVATPATITPNPSEGSQVSSGEGRGDGPSNFGLAAGEKGSE